MSIKFSVFVGLHHLILLILCHTGKERKCLHKCFCPDFPGVKKIMCFLNYVSFTKLALHRFDNCQVCMAAGVEKKYWKCLRDMVVEKKERKKKKETETIEAKIEQKTEKTKAKTETKTEPAA